jgi:hypothetical protein
MSYANHIAHKTQLAAQAYLQAAVTAGTLTLISSGSIYAGLGADTVTAQRVVCVCRAAENEETLNIGNWVAELEIITRSPFADTTEDDFHLLCSEVWAHFFVSESDLQTGLSNATIEYTAFKHYIRAQSWDIEPGADGQPAEWVSRLTLAVKCCGSVIA